MLVDMIHGECEGDNLHGYKTWGEPHGRYPVFVDGCKTIRKKRYYPERCGGYATSWLANRCLST